jgi:hypothetical protein
MSAKIIKICMSVLAVVFVILHLFFPDLKIDGITLGLLLLGVVPWLAPVIKSFELPGGLKIELQDMVQATAGISEASTAEERKPINKKQFLFQMVVNDPNLTLAGLRIEIEGKLRKLATQRMLPVEATMPLNVLLVVLADRNVISLSEKHALIDLIPLLNKAVHGASVEPAAAEWALETGPKLLDTLERKLSLRPLSE